MTDNDRLIFQRALKDGRVLALNVWNAGFQELIYPNLKAFEAAKLAVERDGQVPNPTGYAKV